ncbi:MAG: precorrin-3B C(17)-methyltransferase [Blautia sp.]|nr:precorrin-3B C(17)-methyltransferase [Blautia sp.]
MSELYLVGLGPGNRENMTGAALSALEKADVLCGYTVYVDLVRDWFPDKETYTTPMTREMERCRWAVSTAASGRSVAMLCSGDAGIYGMAGPVMELAADDPRVEIIPVPGITAAVSGAAILGAPLMNDFAVISLSDRLTPPELIRKRLHGAGMGDFVVCLYNPASRQRRTALRDACDILLQYRAGDTLCGWVRNIGRNGQEKELLTLDSLREAQLDMFTTVYIGTETTERAGEWMVTQRGYDDHIKDDLYCEKLVEQYLNNDDPEKHDTISLEDLARREGIIL